MIKTLTVEKFLDIHELLPDKPTFFDIESEALYVNTSLIQLGQDDKLYLIRVDSNDDEEKMREFLEEYYLIGYNLSYDLGTMRFSPTNLEDLFYAVKIAYPQIQQFSLDKVAEYFSIDLYEGIDKKELQKASFIRKAYLSQEQLRYASADITILKHLWNNTYIRNVIEHNLAYKLGRYALLEVAVWQNNGMPVLFETVEKYQSKAKEEIERLRLELREVVGRDINPRSAPQVKEYFGTNSSDKATLTRIVINGAIDESHKSSTGRGIEQSAMTFNEEDRKAAELMLALRKRLNEESKLKKYIYPTLYGRFNPLGASTSRFTCKGGDNPKYFNAQNYPRQFKAVFGVRPNSGRIIVAADYATLEIRIAAEIMNEPAMHNALMKGEDIHKKTASMIYNKPIEQVEGRERSNAKVANFGFTYGMGVGTFIQYAFDLYGIKFTDKEASDLRKKFFKAYPGLARYHSKVGNAMRRGNYICQTALGYKMKPKTYTEAINGPTQGTGAECMRLAIHRMVKKDIRTLKYITNSIHDAIYLIVPEEEKDYWANLLSTEMVAAWNEVRKSALFNFRNTPMKADVMFGYNMGELEEDFAGGGQALSVEEMREMQERNKNG